MLCRRKHFFILYTLEWCRHPLHMHSGAGNRFAFTTSKLFRVALSYFCQNWADGGKTSFQPNFHSGQKWPNSQLFSICWCPVVLGELFIWTLTDFHWASTFYFHHAQISFLLVPFSIFLTMDIYLWLPSSHCWDAVPKGRAGGRDAFYMVF